MTIQTDIDLENFGFEMNVLALDMEDLESKEDLEFKEDLESKEDLQSKEDLESTEDMESMEDLEFSENFGSEESTYQVTGEMTVVNFDKLDTPLIDCSAITINLLLVIMFVALATVGGVLNE